MTPLASPGDDLHKDQVETVYFCLFVLLCLCPCPKWCICSVHGLYML